MTIKFDKNFNWLGQYNQAEQSTSACVHALNFLQTSKETVGTN